MRKPVKPRGRDRRVTVEEIKKILAATASAELRTIVTLAVETGMRRNELASLLWEDLEKLPTCQKRRQMYFAQSLYLRRLGPP